MWGRLYFAGKAEITKEDVTPFVKYMLRIILATYRDFEERVDLVSEKLPAKEIVRRAVYSKM
ncbi:MAG: hypothetical protein PUC12_09225, partial [Clostridiales bacterium]|nr:hypothetical protein [Clostridiales bacterium]